ncbi:unnamed protein product [Rotaria sp. Silwood1]|nr:unnamed protein product [Rotaria sp. Silwood1]
MEKVENIYAFSLTKVSTNSFIAENLTTNASANSSNNGKEFMVATNLCQNSVNTGPITVPNESGDEPIGIENDPSEHIGNPTDMQNPPDVSQTLTMIQNIDANQTEADKESTGMETAVNVPNTSTVVQSIDANQIEAGKESKGMETSVDVSKTLIMTGDMGIDQTKESGKPSDIQNSPDVLSIPPVSQTVVKDNCNYLFFLLSKLIVFSIMDSSICSNNVLQLFLVMDRPISVDPRCLFRSGNFEKSYLEEIFQ